MARIPHHAATENRILNPAVKDLYHRRAQARINADQNHRARRALNVQIRAERDADRAKWETALDGGWLRWVLSFAVSLAPPPLTFDGKVGACGAVERVELRDVLV
jgi:hypothetical protein